ncbi:MAG: sensor domain-containing diguanylate cyclase [Chloroflexi bacterium]|nr:MAG: sensor domain-containing diguanylate cyclase [Chloroflexota bacterium]TME56047.1 MAG: sensor domain-containing diguanylate cyclase [Chloroflexota bacterium]
MTERASDLLGELADRLSADSRDSGQVVAESVRTLEPELLRMQKEGGSIDDLVRTSVGFLEILFRSLRADARVPWQHYYNLARVASRRYAERGIPLDSVLEGLAVFRRSVMARVTEEVAGRDYADEVLLLAQSRLGEVVEHLSSSFMRGYLDSTEQRFSARQSELNGLYQIASALGRSLDVVEIAEVGLRETLTVLRLQAGAVWTREGARLTLAKTVGLQPGEEEEFESGRAGGRVRVVEIASGPAESRVDRIAGEWSAIRAELRTKGVLLGAMTVATRLPRTFEPSDLAFVAAVADQIAVALDRARQHTREARTDYLTGLANRPEFERAIDRAVAASERHKRRLVLMMIDLDNLKEINDHHGHHIGDEAIRVLAHELQRAVRATDTCGRLGGDEFGVAMPDADERHANEVGGRVRAALEELNRQGNAPVPVEFSIGVVAWRPGMDWQAMYQLADKALYVDKRRRHAHRKKVGAGRAQGASG